MMRDIPFGKPIIEQEEKEAVARVLDGPILTHGPLVKEFEADFATFTGAPYAVAVSSCTAGLHLAYLALGIGVGDEVIVPAQSHVATAHAVELVGATTIFADAEISTGNIDISSLEKLVTAKTKAISIVHYLGMPVNMDEIMSFAKKHDLYVIEDCALAIGTKFKGVHAGLYGDVGCFSFYPVKHITTAEGGMLITKNHAIADAVSKLRAFGIDRNIVSERKIPGMYDVQELGYNYRLNEIGAAMGIEQLKKVSRFLEQRQDNYVAMQTELRNVDNISLFQSSNDNFLSSYYCLSILLDEKLMSQRYQIMDRLKLKGIGSSIYYPKAIPDMTYYRKKYGEKYVICPVAQKISNTSIALPVGPHLTVDDMKYITSSLKTIFKEV
jgi:dTDP-4-amino-4,6-dideoxygalactose transaminase